MQNAAKISPTNFRVTSVLGTKREGDETARGRNDHKACVLYAKNITGTCSPRSRMSTSEISVQGKTFRLI